jgi:hypothetical protein
VIHHRHSRAFHDRRGDAREPARIGSEDQVGAVLAAQPAIDFRGARGLAAVIAAFERQPVAAAAGLESARRFGVRDEQPQRGLGLTAQLGVRAA